MDRAGRGHHRWLYVSPAEIAEIAEISKGTQIPQISQIGAITDGVLYGVA